MLANQLKTVPAPEDPTDMKERNEKATPIATQTQGRP